MTNETQNKVQISAEDYLKQVRETLDRYEQEQQSLKFKIDHYIGVVNRTRKITIC